MMLDELLSLLSPTATPGAPGAPGWLNKGSAVPWAAAPAATPAQPGVATAPAPEMTVPMPRPRPAEAPAGDALPPNATPTMGVGAPMSLAPPTAAAAPAAEPGILDRLSAASHAMRNAPGLPGLFDAIGSGMSGKRVDPEGRALQAQNQTVAALMKRGVAEDIARTAVANPSILQQILPAAFGPRTFTFEKMPDGSIVRIDPTSKEPPSKVYDPYPATGTSAGGDAIPSPPPGADPVAWRKQWAELKAKNVAGSTLPASVEETQRVHKTVVDLPSYKNLAQAAPIYRSMFETAGRNTKASDLNLVYGLGKIMDPTSVVREGEMVMVKNTASLPDWLVGAINQLNGGSGLTPDTRKAIMTEAYSRAKAYEDQYKDETEHYRGVASRNRMPVEDIIPVFKAATPWEPAAPPSPSPLAAPPAVAPGRYILNPTTGKLEPQR